LSQSRSSEETKSWDRLNVLEMLLENLGIEQVIRFGKLGDWKAAIADLKKKQGSGNQT
jgi:hypothetical protein